MACFVAPATVAIITTVTRKKIDPKYHIEWLNTMMWGGVLMLIVEHISHGEVVLFPPFFTAMRTPADILIMFREIATTGISMALAIIVTWAIIMFFSFNRGERTLKNKIITA